MQTEEPMGSTFEKKVETFMKKKNLTAPGDRVLIGLSGGADSVCLLTVLRELADALFLSLGAFHVNHGIRGEEADRDEAFSKELCECFGIPFYGVNVSVPELAKEWQMGLEEAGRRVRYETAERLATEHGYDKIALAHHRNDVAETLLFHLFRGSSVSGLASIPAKRGRIIRPLLSCEREEIVTYLEGRGSSYCTDTTNGETEYTRNKIRHRLVAVAENEINAGAVRHMAETAEECAELCDYLEGETQRICTGAEMTEEELSFSASLLLREHGVLQKRAIHEFIGRVSGSKKDITREHVEAVRELLHSQSGSRIFLPYGVIAGRDFDRVFIRVGSKKTEETKTEPQMIQVPGEYCVGNGGESLRFRLFPCKKNAEIPKNEYTKWFDYDKIRGTLFLRTYREGDRIGLKCGRKTVKSLWVEHKVPVEQRNTRVLLTDEEQVLWIPGVRCCDNYRIDAGTKTVLEVQRSGGYEDGSEC